MHFAVADVTGNVKYIRKGDYRLLSGGGGLGTTLLLRLRSKENRSSYAVSS